MQDQLRPMHENAFGMLWHMFNFEQVFQLTLETVLTLCWTQHVQSLGKQLVFGHTLILAASSSVTITGHLIDPVNHVTDWCEYASLATIS